MCALWVYHEHMTPFIDDRSMNMTFCNQSFLCSRGLVMVCRAMLEPDTASLTTPEEVDSGSAMIVNLQMNWHLSFLTISVARHTSLSISPSLFRPDFLQTRKTNRITRPLHRNGPDRIAPHRTAPPTPLSLATANCLQPPATRLTAYSQLPHHRLHPRHATPFHRLWHHKITT